MSTPILKINAVDPESKELAEAIESFSIGKNGEKGFIASVLAKTEDPQTYREIYWDLHPEQVETLKSLLSLWITSVK